MSDTSLTLFIDLSPNSRIDLRVAAKAAISWANMVEDVGIHFDPSAPPTIQLEASEPGSQKLKTIISSLSDDPKADIRTAIVSALVFLGMTTAAWTWEQVLEWISGPDAPAETIQLSDDEREKLAREVAEALNNNIGRKPAKRVYDDLSADENVTGVGVTASPSRRPQTIISRDSFPPDVYVVEEEGLEKRSRVEEVELVLLRPVLTRETNKRWGFAWPHGKLGATIKDHGFLERMVTGELGIQMAEGIVFCVQLEIIEERKGTVWEVKEYTILKVLKIQAPAQQGGFDLDVSEQPNSDNDDS